MERTRTRREYTAGQEEAMDARKETRREREEGERRCEMTTGKGGGTALWTREGGARARLVRCALRRRRAVAAAAVVVALRLGLAVAVRLSVRVPVLVAERREALALALGGEELVDRDEVLRVRGRVLAQVGELDRRLGEQGIALLALRRAEALCAQERPRGSVALVPTTTTQREKRERERRTLHDVVGVRVNEHGLDDARAVGRRREHLVEQARALVLAAVHDALLDDVGRKFLLRERQELAEDLGDDERAVGRVALLEHPLDDVLQASRREQGQVLLEHNELEECRRGESDSRCRTGPA